MRIDHRVNVLLQQQLADQMAPKSDSSSWQEITNEWRLQIDLDQGQMILPVTVTSGWSSWWASCSDCLELRHQAGRTAGDVSDCDGASGASCHGARAGFGGTLRRRGSGRPQRGFGQGGDCVRWRNMGTRIPDGEGSPLGFSPNPDGGGRRWSSPADQRWGGVLPTRPRNPDGGEPTPDGGEERTGLRNGENWDALYGVRTGAASFSFTAALCLVRWARRRYRRAGMRGYGEKKIVFSRNALQIAIFWYFIVLPPYPLPKTYDGWVRREG
jgi:hypothetical protein